jgi:hypothetical protein
MQVSDTHGKKEMLTVSQNQHSCAHKEPYDLE